MRDEASSDVLKVWLHAAASVLLGAWISPLLYNMGKGLAEVSEGKQTNGPLEWLAGVCRTADFPAFFAASLLLAAAILLLPLIQWLRGGRQPEAARGQRLRKNPLGARQAHRFRPAYPLSPSDDRRQFKPVMLSSVPSRAPWRR